MSQRSRLQTVSCTVVIPNGQQTANSADKPAYFNGLLRAIYIDAPALTGATYSITIVGPASGMTLFTKSSLTPNGQTNILDDTSFAGGNAPLEIPMEGACGVTITSAGTEGAQRTFSVSLVIDRGTL